jgi:aryl-alcohol dehydrogenase-like predicted oxidoreductase
MKLLKKDGVKVFARTILNFGIFTENFLRRKKINFKINDHRSKWNIKQILFWRNYAMKIKKLSKRSIENTCYKFCNSFDVSSLIIGATTKHHIDQALTSNNKVKLNKNEINKINTIYRDYSKNLILKPKIPIKTSFQI